MVTHNTHEFFADYFDKGYLNPYLYELSLKMAEGNVCLDLNENLQDQSQEIRRSFHYDKSKLLQHPMVGLEGEMQPFIWHDDKLYMQRYFQYESNFVENIKRLIAHENFNTESKKLQESKDFIQALFPAKNNDIDWQAIAALSSLLHRFHIITGGPGTGKTTSVAKILSVVFHQHPDAKILLAAPTGKAAVRMAESLSGTSNKLSREQIDIPKTIIEKIQQLTPTTIHSMLGYRQGSIYFKHNADNPLDADVVVIDECSMIDIALFSKLLSAVGDHTKLILLGDKNQLSSVESGSLFGDLCSALPTLNKYDKQYQDFFMNYLNIRETELDENQSHPLFQHITELQESHRFSSSSGIGKCSHAIINGDEQTVNNMIAHQDDQLEIIDSYDETIVEKFALKFKAFMQEKDIAAALHDVNNAKILCAVKQGRQGVYRINQLVEQYLGQQNIIHPHQDLYENKLIMVTKNQPEIGLYNGDTGIIRFYQGRLRACFLTPGGEVLFVLPALIQQKETAYAITIHKSQGSEFDEVLIILPTKEDSPLMNRELLYTAVTRAKTKAIIVASKQAMLHTIRKTTNRISGIVNRFNP